jgi:hypothetical protein
MRVGVPSLRSPHTRKPHLSLDTEVDIQKKRWRDPQAEERGVQFTRLIVKYNGETHIYQFPDDEFPDAMEIIRLHVLEGQLHPYAGMVLMGMT